MVALVTAVLRRDHVWFEVWLHGATGELMCSAEKICQFNYCFHNYSYYYYHHKYVTQTNLEVICL